MPEEFYEMSGRDLPEDMSAFMRFEPFEWVMAMTITANTVPSRPSRFRESDLSQLLTGFLEGMAADGDLDVEKIDAVEVPTQVGDLSKTFTLPITAEVLDIPVDEFGEGWDVAFDATVFVRDGAIGIVIVVNFLHREGGPFSPEYAEILDERIVELLPHTIW